MVFCNWNETNFFSWLLVKDTIFKPIALFSISATRKGCIENIGTKWQCHPLCSFYKKIWPKSAKGNGSQTFKGLKVHNTFI